MDRTRRHCKRAFIALLLFLTGCAPYCREWVLDSYISKNPRFASARVYLPPSSPSDHLELELCRSASGYRLYLNILLFAARPLEEDSQKTEIEISTLEKSWTAYPYILLGGQRLFIPSETADELIQLLLEGISFTIKIGRLETEISPSNFRELYIDLKNFDIGYEACPCPYPEPEPVLS